MAGVLPISLFLYLAMKNGYITFGIPSLRQKKEHEEKEWVIERSKIPIKSGNVRFEVETDVKWCPQTDEIFYRKPQETGFFEEDWAEVTEYSDLYKRLLANFRRKHVQQPNRRTSRSKWTVMNQ